MQENIFPFQLSLSGSYVELILGILGSPEAPEGAEAEREPEVARMIDAPVSWRAPVAQMI